MEIIKQNLLGMAVVSIFAGHTSADAFTDALTSGKAYGDFRLRYESADQDNAAKDATALTLRSKLGYKTGSVAGLSAVLEFEDSRIIGGVDEFTVGPTGFNAGEYSVIADPETTEVDQAFLQYKSNRLTAKLGRQVITLDGHRHVGHVGWRQDRQTFDAVRLTFSPADSVKVDLAYINQRNRIFAEVIDTESSDVLANVSFKTSVGKVVTYAYLLDDETLSTELDTYGISLKGATEGDMPILYAVEFATQDVVKGSVKADVDFFSWSLGTKISGFTVKLGQEVFGAKDGANFATPLATLHKFQGWNDVFLGNTFNPTGNLSMTGLEDSTLTVMGKVGPGKLMVVYHDFSSEETGADFGTEVDVSYSMTFGKNYYAGVKFGIFDTDGYSVDTDKLWLWTGLKF